MKRIVLSIAMALISAAAGAAGTEMPANLNVAVTITSADKVIATESATVEDRQMHTFEAKARPGHPGYHVEITPGLMPDMPDQVLVRTQLRVSTISSVKQIKANSMPPMNMPEVDSCVSSNSSRITLGKPTQVLMILNGSALPPGCGISITVTKAPASTH